mmetsp:Transcript_31845/g.81005  ORF Transcript_31845/g.81005 Transcript_31845/m.81005 type:complete len:298 (-) Transcript_31845:322-1215(-)
MHGRLVKAGARRGGAEKHHRLGAARLLGHPRQVRGREVDEPGAHGGLGGGGSGALGKVEGLERLGGGSLADLLELGEPHVLGRVGPRDQLFGRLDGAVVGGGASGGCGRGGGGGGGGNDARGQHPLAPRGRRRRRPSRPVGGDGGRQGAAEALRDAAARGGSRGLGGVGGGAEAGELRLELRKAVLEFRVLVDLVAGGVARRELVAILVVLERDGGHGLLVDRRGRGMELAVAVGLLGRDGLGHLADGILVLGEARVLVVGEVLDGGEGGLALGEHRLYVLVAVCHEAPLLASARGA